MCLTSAAFALNCFVSTKLYFLYFFKWNCWNRCRLWAKAKKCMISESENCLLCHHELKYLEDSDLVILPLCSWRFVHCSKGFQKVVIWTGLFRSEDILAPTEDFWPSCGSELGPFNDPQQFCQPASKNLLSFSRVSISTTLLFSLT